MFLDMVSKAKTVYDNDTCGSEWDKKSCFFKIGNLVLVTRLSHCTVFLSDPDPF